VIKNVSALSPPIRFNEIRDIEMGRNVEVRVWGRFKTREGGNESKGCSRCLDCGHWKLHSIHLSLQPFCFLVCLSAVWMIVKDNGFRVIL
jgi:hypothetical protein